MEERDAALAKAEELSKEVMIWWEKHQYDVDIAAGGDFAEEFNRYDEIPGFVKSAQCIIEQRNQSKQSKNGGENEKV